jgi:hypothetical protein
MFLFGCKNLPFKRSSIPLSSDDRLSHAFGERKRGVIAHLAINISPLWGLVSFLFPRERWPTKEVGESF